MILKDYLLNLEMKIYNSAIISNLPNTILMDKISLDTKSRSMLVIPTEKPVFERAAEDSNNASIKSILLMQEIVVALTIDSMINNIITKIASLIALSDSNDSF